MTIEDIYNHFTIPKDVKKVNISPNMSSVISRMKKQESEFNEKIKLQINDMISTRNSIVENIFKFQDSNRIHIPVNLNTLLIIFKVNNKLIKIL